LVNPYKLIDQAVNGGVVGGDFALHKLIFDLRRGAWLSFCGFMRLGLL
jgi:hypothetical protein